MFNDGTVDGGIRDKITKFEMIHKWWGALHDFERLAHLKDAMKRRHYKTKFSNEEINSAHEMIIGILCCYLKIFFATVSAIKTKISPHN